ncbi:MULTISPECIES: ribosome biogenesis GTPase YlqF [Sedimentibacter]|uniref:Ribosome biogenesis GTPase A n=1 Tax=Sedimentibacter hydroxybenzoicus DSM 7310 TaxID=1123245 RepID=A0A974BMH3_SEDHY|nr:MULTISPECIES: ribosome biogenesis GTPase YlqF [Sedimentibacter]NYB75541.1 ribosome biogenesis GTPase YlqF [Sedimentibacter hydroxybenzoicus DSM 7310]
MNINWYPGHMKKTKDLLQENLKLVNIVIEVIDARIPISSKNPDFDNLFRDKKRLIVLNKYDLADPNLNKAWEAYYKSKGWSVVLYNSTNNKELRKLDNAIAEASKEIVERYKKRGLLNRTIKAMIVGIPNVGKSTLINSLAKRKSAKTGNMPGVTKGKQWIRLTGNIDLLDTPGILWPKFDDDKLALNLAFTGAIRDEVIVLEEISLKFVEKMIELNKVDAILEKYDIEQGEKPLDILDNIAYKKGFLLNKTEIDYLRVANLLFNDFRNGKLGNITLEKPEELN